MTRSGVICTKVGHDNFVTKSGVYLSAETGDGGRNWRLRSLGDNLRLWSFALNGGGRHPKAVRLVLEKIVDFQDIYFQEKILVTLD